MPSLQRAKAQAMQIRCLANSRQMGLALLMYSEDYNGYVVPTRHGGGQLDTGDPYRNGWHSNLVPYLDPSKTMQRVADMTGDKPLIYNSIWNSKKMVCPAEKAEVSPYYGGGGIKYVTYGIHWGSSLWLAPGIDYTRGWGLIDADTGKTRRLVDVRSGTIVFCDTRNVEYFYAMFYQLMEPRPEGADTYIPARHPLGYCGTFADGSSTTIRKEVIQDDIYNPMWRAR